MIVNNKNLGTVTDVKLIDLTLPEGVPAYSFPFVTTDLDNKSVFCRHGLYRNLIKKVCGSTGLCGTHGIAGQGCSANSQLLRGPGAWKPSASLFLKACETMVTEGWRGGIADGFCILSALVCESAIKTIKALDAELKSADRQNKKLREELSRKQDRVRA